MTNPNIPYIPDESEGWDHAAFWLAAFGETPSEIREKGERAAASIRASLYEQEVLDRLEADLVLPVVLDILGYIPEEDLPEQGSE